MKNSLIFKFLAILLCAACLLGAVSSGTSLAVLASGNLFNRSVDQMLAEMDENNGSSFAYNLAQSYASAALGSCPEDFLRQHYGRSGWFDNVYETYGYALLDKEGNVLDSLRPELKDSATLYTYDVTGQYMHLVSATPESEKYPAPTASERIPYSGTNVELLDAIPPEGAEFCYMNFGGADGSTGIGSDEPMGFVYYDGNGKVCFRTYDAHHGLLDTTPTNILEVLMVAITRHVILSHDDPWSNVACIACIAGLFAIRRFLVLRSELKEEMLDLE